MNHYAMSIVSSSKLMVLKEKYMIFFYKMTIYFATRYGKLAQSWLKPTNHRPRNEIYDHNCWLHFALVVAFIHFRISAEDKSVTFDFIFEKHDSECWTVNKEKLH